MELYVLIGLGIVITSALTLIFAVKKKIKSLFFGILWFYIAFIPYSGLIILNAVYLEHWFYVPFIGLLFVLTHLLSQIKKQQISIPILSLCIGLLIYRSHLRNLEWKDPEKFYFNELSYAPESSRMLVNLSIVYSNKGEYKKAEGILNRVLKTDPNSIYARYNLGLINFSYENYTKAEEYFLSIVTTNPNYAYSYIQLFKIYRTNNDPKKDHTVYIIDKIAKEGHSSISESDIAPLFEDP